jgi:hypothetical protein
MSKVDQLIEKFKEFKEELNKNVNHSYSNTPNGATGMPASMGTSGGQGGMYRSEMEKQMISASPGGAQDMMVVKFDQNGQWRMEKAGWGTPNIVHSGANAGMHFNHPTRGNMSITKQPTGKWEVKHNTKSVGTFGAPHEAAAHARSLMNKMEEAEKGDAYISEDGTNREANPKLRASDLGPGGKVHMIKEEGTNEEANPTQPHNKGKFKVMPMTSEKDQKHAEVAGKPYNGKDKDVKKGEDCKQGNEAKGFDENKAPGRGTLGV